MFSFQVLTWHDSHLVIDESRQTIFCCSYTQINYTVHHLKKTPGEQITLIVIIYETMPFIIEYIVLLFFSTMTCNVKNCYFFSTHHEDSIYSIYANKQITSHMWNIIDESNFFLSYLFLFQLVIFIFWLLLTMFV